MATTAGHVCFSHLSHLQALYPAPLHIKKKSRKSIRLRLLQRKPTHGQIFPPCGPLDDIINEIVGDIWRSPPENTWEWPATLDAPFLWTVTPLPVSRAPSAQPLAVRKTRTSNSNSRSTASGSTFSDTMSSSQSRDSSKGEYAGFNFAEDPPSSTASSFPSLYNETNNVRESPSSRSQPTDSVETVNANHTPAEQQLSVILEGNASSSKPERPTIRKRFFSLSNGMDRLRLKTSNLARRGSSSESSNSPIAISPPSQVLATPQETAQTEEASPVNATTAEDVAAWMAENGRRASKIGAVLSHAADRYPSPYEYRPELSSIDVATPVQLGASSSTLAASVRIIPEVKVLTTEEEQTFWVAIEVEGVQHNRRALSDQGIDIVCVVDNSYYVTDDCLNRALDVATRVIYDLNKGDRLGLYTTHCTHETVTGTVPDTWYPLGSADSFATDIFRDMVSNIRQLGTQAWNPPRPNPSLDEVLVSVAKTLQQKGTRSGRTHILLLSPVARNIHGFAKSHPSLQVHQINPGVLPFQVESETDNPTCVEKFCPNVTTSNISHYQSVTDRVRQIIRYARSEKPVGSIHDVQLDIRRRPGCEVIRYEGSRNITHLRLGQVHTFFALLQVQRSQTQEMDLESNDPIRDSVLNAHNLGTELRNARALGASKVHLLCVQIMHQSSMVPSTQWTYAETPLFVIKELGRLAMPTDRAMELYKRRFFYSLSQMDLDSTVSEMEKLYTMVKPELKEQSRKILHHMAKEVECHKAIVEYQKNSRQNLPSCVGPISLPYAHAFLAEKWEARKRRRMGVLVEKF